MVKRILGKVFSRQVLGKVVNRRTATLLRWKTLGPNLSEINRGSRFLESKIFPRTSYARSIQRLHDGFRGRSFKKLGHTTILNSLAAKVKSRRPATFHGNQYVKLYAKSWARVPLANRSKLSRFGRQLW